MSKKKVPQSQKDQMTVGTLRSLRRLLIAWDYQCIVCGHEFMTMSCVTREHLIPRSMGGTRGGDNVGPSHWRCNQYRGSLSLIKAHQLMASKRSEMPMQFFTWLNAPVPNRNVPHEANAVLLTAGFMELPEWLPGTDTYHHAGKTTSAQGIHSRGRSDGAGMGSGSMVPVGG